MQNSERISPIHCPGDQRNCELLPAAAGPHRERCAEARIVGREAVVSAMAVGLVIDVWRNSPVEDMHASAWSERCCDVR